MTDDMLALANRNREKLEASNVEFRKGVIEDFGRSVSTADSLWIIALCPNGFFGLISIYFVLLHPVFKARKYLKKRETKDGDYCMVLGATLVCLMIAIDGLLNYMLNPFWLLINASLTSVLSQPAQTESLPEVVEASRETKPKPRIFYA